MSYYWAQNAKPLHNFKVNSLMLSLCENQLKTEFGNWDFSATYSLTTWLFVALIELNLHITDFRCDLNHMKNMSWSTTQYTHQWYIMFSRICSARKPERWLTSKAISQTLMSFVSQMINALNKFEYSMCCQTSHYSNSWIEYCISGRLERH